jgi:uncharacterized protein (TIGR03437 family)
MTERETMLRMFLRDTLLSVALLAGIGSAQTAPSIDAVVNGANYRGGALGADRWISIFGSNLSPCTTTDDTFPTTIACDTGDVMVTANGTPLRLHYASPTQLNVLAPSTPGNYDFVVQNAGVASTPNNATVSATSIAVFNNYHLSATINQDNTVHWYNNPARPGDIVSVYANAGGPTTSTETIQTGAQTTVLEHTQAPSVSMDGQPLSVLFAGKAPGYQGLWQYNISLPTDATTGAHTLQFCLNDTCDTADILIAPDKNNVAGNATLVQSRVAPTPLLGPLNGTLTNNNSGTTTTFTTTPFHNFLVPANGRPTDTMRLTLDGLAQYASLNRTTTLTALEPPQFITLPQLTYDQNALFTIDTTQPVQDPQYPERSLWVPGTTPLVNRDFAFYSTSLYQCLSGTTDFACSYIPPRWARLPIQLNLNLSQVPDGQSYLDGNLVDTKQGLVTVAQRYQVNGQQFYKIVDNFDPTQPGVEVQWSPNICDFELVTTVANARQYGIITLYELNNAAIPGTLAEFLHESEHAAGLWWHSDSPNHYIYFDTADTMQMLLDFKGVPTPGEQSALGAC